jgi:hypothetical protein
MRRRRTLADRSGSPDGELGAPTSARRILRPHAGTNYLPPLCEREHSTAVGIPPLRNGIICIQAFFSDARGELAGDSLRYLCICVYYMYLDLYIYVYMNPPLK